MPLDGHAHLVRQGWSGKGNGLRHGAITKPVTVVQKKSLAGIGKDRDEAFPFWDHVFQAAVSSIQVKIHNSDDESDSDDTSTPAVTLQRTSTGIISNRRPVTGTPAIDSGSTTPSDSLAPRVSVMAAAKQQAARRMLYSMFYRGPVLSTEEEAAVADDLAHVAGLSTSSLSAHAHTSTPSNLKAEKERKKSKKRRAEKDDVDEERQERKRRKRESKEKEQQQDKKASKKKAPRANPVQCTDVESDGEEADGENDSKAVRAARKAEKAEKKRRKEEKRARKEEKRKRKAERATTVEDYKSELRDEGGGNVELAAQIEAATVELRDPQERKAKRTKDSSTTSKKKSKMKSS